MKTAFFIVMTAAALISLILLSTRFSETFTTYRLSKRQDAAEETPGLKGWSLLLGLMLIAWVAAIILVGIFINKIVSLTLGCLISIVITAFDGEKSADTAKTIKYDKISLVLATGLLAVFLTFSILSKILL